MTCSERRRYAQRSGSCSTDARRVCYDQSRTTRAGFGPRQGPVGVPTEGAGPVVGEFELRGGIQESQALVFIGNKKGSRSKLNF